MKRNGEELNDQQIIAEDFIIELIDKGAIQQALGATELCARMHLLTRKQAHRIAFREVGPEDFEEATGTVAKANKKQA
jgi:hypothetical protein